MYQSKYYCSITTFTISFSQLNNMAAKYVTEGSFINSTSKNKLDDLQYLLMKGFNCNEIAGENGLSLFHMVVADDCEDFALQGTQLCLNYGGNPNLRSLDGLTPTNLCCVWGRTAVFELLLNNGGDPSIKDVYGMDSRAYALKEGYLDILDTISNFESNGVSRNLCRINPNKYEFVKEWCDKCASPAADSSDTSNLEKYLSQESIRSNQMCSTELEDNNNKNLSFMMTYDTKCNETSVQTESNDYVSCKSSIAKFALTFEKSNFNQDLIISGIEPISSVYSQILSKTNTLKSHDNYLSDTYDKHKLKSHDDSLLDNYDEFGTKAHGNHFLDANDEDNLKSHNSSLGTCADNPLENHDNHFMKSTHSLESHDEPLTQLHGNCSLKSPNESITQSHGNFSLESHDKSITQSHGKCLLEARDELIMQSHSNSTLESPTESTFTESYENRTLESHNNPFLESHDDCSLESHDKAITELYNNHYLESHKKPYTQTYNNHSLESHDEPLSKLHNNHSIKSYDKSVTQISDNFSLEPHGKPFTQTYENRSLESLDEPCRQTCDNRSLVHYIKSQDNNQYRDNQMISSLESYDESFFDANDEAILESPDNKHDSLHDFSHIDDELSIITADNDDSEIRVNRNVTMRRYYPLYDQEEECSLLIKDFNQSPSKQLPNISSDNDEINAVTDAIEKLSLFPLTNTSITQKRSENLMPVSSPSESYMAIAATDAIEKLSLFPLTNTSITKKRSENLMPVSSPSESYMAIAEEKKFLVDDIGVELVERRYLVTPCLSQSDADETMSNVSTECSIPKSVDYDTDSLRKELKSLGLNPGPITNSTKIVYIKKLLKLKKHPERLQINNTKIVYSPELEKTLKNINWTQDLKKYIVLENGLSEQFSKANPKKVWRGGNQKTSFTYLLLDPRITNNLPARVNITTVTDSWATFIESIFYVGKGIRSRPYAHLYQAVEFWNKTSDCKKNVNDKKVRRILDIWEAGLGVICLNVFQHVIAVEAFTREAAMIDALCIKNLTNIKSGEYYGISTGWSCKDKRNLGVYLLHRAMNIFLNEGERQIHPADIK